MVWEGGGLPFFSFGQEGGGGGRGYCQKIMYDVGGGVFKNFAP